MADDDNPKDWHKRSKNIINMSLVPYALQVLQWLLISTEGADFLKSGPLTLTD
jgi:hypothetical protein